MHLDGLLTCAAVNTLIGHGSTYYHNYHMGLDGPGRFGRWRMSSWDTDKTWGGSSYGPDLPYYWVTNDISSPNTLMWRLWCTPHTRGLLMARLADLSVDFVPWAASGVVDSLAALVEPLVQRPVPDYTMEEFHQSVQVIRDCRLSVAVPRTDVRHVAPSLPSLPDGSAERRILPGPLDQAGRSSSTGLPSPPIPLSWTNRRYLGKPSRGHLLVFAAGGRSRLARIIHCRCGPSTITGRRGP